jgi:hypothetical protein
MIYSSCVVDKTPFSKVEMPLGYVPPLLDKVSSARRGAGRNLTAQEVEDALVRGGTRTLMFIISGLRTSG